MGTSWRCNQIELQRQRRRHQSTSIPEPSKINSGRNAVCRPANSAHAPQRDKSTTELPWRVSDIDHGDRCICIGSCCIPSFWTWSLSRQKLYAEVRQLLNSKLTQSYDHCLMGNQRSSSFSVMNVLPSHGAEFPVWTVAAWSLIYQSWTRKITDGLLNIGHDSWEVDWNAESNIDGLARLAPGSSARI